MILFDALQRSTTSDRSWFVFDNERGRPFGRALDYLTQREAEMIAQAMHYAVMAERRRAKRTGQTQVRRGVTPRPSNMHYPRPVPLPLPTQ